jgi:hypothetical protein
MSTDLHEAIQHLEGVVKQQGAEVAKASGAMVSKPMKVGAGGFAALCIAALGWMKTDISAISETLDEIAKSQVQHKLLEQTVVEMRHDMESADHRAEAAAKTLNTQGKELALLKQRVDRIEREGPE